MYTTISRSHTTIQEREEDSDDVMKVAWGLRGYCFEAMRHVTGTQSGGQPLLSRLASLSGLS